MAVLIFAIATQVFPVIWPFYTVEAFGFTPFMTGVSYTILGLAMAASQGLLVKASVAVIVEMRTVHYTILCGIATLTALVLVTDGIFFPAMIPLISIAFVVAPTIQRMMSQRMGDDRQVELKGLFGSLAALSMIVGPVLTASIFRLFAASDATIHAPGAPCEAAAALIWVTLLLFDVASGREAFVKVEQPLTELC